ncbi:MAG: hypothetical protein ACXADY_25425 [Candidatus Hodarchaeales archaeon]|jgi:hypothetical protein
MEMDESMQLIRTVEFYYTNNQNLDYFTTQECYSSDPLPDTLLFLLYKTSDNIDFKNLLRLHDEYSAFQITNRKGTVYLSTLKISLDSFLMTDTRQQYIEQITQYFAGFREMFAKAFMDVHTRPLTLDELIEAVF